MASFGDLLLNRKQEKLFVSLNDEVTMYGLLTKCEDKMAGYWPSSFLACRGP